MVKSDNTCLVKCSARPKLESRWITGVAITEHPRTILPHPGPYGATPHDMIKTRECWLTTGGGLCRRETMSQHTENVITNRYRNNLELLNHPQLCGTPIVKKTSGKSIANYTLPKRLRSQRRTHEKGRGAFQSCGMIMIGKSEIKNSKMNPSF